MAVTSIAQSTRLIVKVETGIGANGKPVYKNRSYANVKTTAADSDIYAIGLALANLQKYSPALIHRVDEGNLTNV